MKEEKVSSREVSRGLVHILLPTVTKAIIWASPLGLLSSYSTPQRMQMTYAISCRQTYSGEGLTWSQTRCSKRMLFSVPTSPKHTRIKVKQGSRCSNRRPKNSNLDIKKKKGPLGRKDAGEDLDLPARTQERDDSDGEQNQNLDNEVL